MEPLRPLHAVLVSVTMSRYWYTFVWMKPRVIVPAELVVRTAMFCQAPLMYRCR